MTWIGRWNVEYYPTRPKFGIFYADQQVCIYETKNENGRRMLEVYREDTGELATVYKSHKQAGRNPQGRLYYSGDRKAVTPRIKRLVKICFLYCEQIWAQEHAKVIMDVTDERRMDNLTENQRQT